MDRHRPRLRALAQRSAVGAAYPASSPGHSRRDSEAPRRKGLQRPPPTRGPAAPAEKRPKFVSWALVRAGCDPVMGLSVFLSSGLADSVGGFPGRSGELRFVLDRQSCRLLTGYDGRPSSIWIL